MQGQKSSLTKNHPVTHPAMSIDQPVFLRKKIPFYLTLLVIATTLFSWYNVNSVCIMLLLLFRLLDGNAGSLIKSAFSNKYFWAFFSVFLLELIGLCYTHHLDIGWKHVESKATLLALPLVICAGDAFTDRAGRRKLLSAFCILLAAICVYCLVVAAIHYQQEQRLDVFFYHDLSGAVSVNAVFFSGYVICALLFLLSGPLDFGPQAWPNAPLRKKIRVWLIVFFTGMIVLLSSKLLLILLVLILISFLVERYRLQANPLKIFSVALGVLLLIGILGLTDNPIKRRYEDIMQGNNDIYKSEKINPDLAYNGVNLRLIIWRFSAEILGEQRAWLFGVSAGDSQDLLNKKYIAAGMWTGIPGSHNHGFLGYNFHNQYIEVWVRSGLVGLLVYLISCGLMVSIAVRAGTKEAWFTVILILLLNLTESMLEMQHSAFLSCFFPLLLLYGPMRKGGSSPAAGPTIAGHP